MAQEAAAMPLKDMAGAGKSGPVRLDINLLPANPNAARAQRAGLIAVLCVLAAAAAGYFAIAVPAMRLNDLKGQAAAYEAKAEQLAKNETDFNTSVSARNALNAMIDSLDSSGKSVLIPKDVFAQLAQACPEGVTLTSVTIDASGMKLDGLAISDDQIAQFIVNLKTLPKLVSVLLVDSGKSDQVKAGVPGRKFQISALLPVVAASASPGATPAPTPTPEGSDKK